MAQFNKTVRQARDVNDYVSVKDFGAKGDFDGTTGTDDYAAIQAAINYLFSIGGGTLYFPTGKYRITQPLNLAGNATAGRFGNTPIVFKGAGMPNTFDTGSWATYGGSWIVGQTAGWIMDLTGMQYFSCEEMGFRGTGTNASTLGILSARSTVVKFAHNQYFRKCVIWIDTKPTASAVGSIALGNNGAETFLMDHCWLIADTPLALTFNNSTDLNFVSPYVSIEYGPGFLSSTMMNFRNTTFLALTGHATRIQGAMNVFFDTCIWSKDSANTTVGGIQLVAGQTGTAHCQDLRITGQVEQFQSAVVIDDAFIWNVDFNLMLANVTGAYVAVGLAEMNNCRFNFHPAFGATPNYVFNSAFSSKLNGGEVDLYAGGSLTANTNLTSYGALIRGHNVDTSVSLGLNPSSNYLATGTTGTKVVQPAPVLITPNAANNATSGAAPNGLQSQLMSDGTVQLSGTFVPNGATTIAAGVLAGTINAAHCPNREVDTVVYITGVLYYLRILANGSIFLGGNVVGGSGQTANIDCVRYKQFN